MSEGHAKPESGETSHASKPRKSAARSRPTPKAGGKAKPVEPSAGDDRRLHDSAGWREETLDRMRALILEAVPEMVEERKWKKPSNAMAGVPVWSHNGIVCTGETYKKVVKLTFARGASLPDPSHLFNSSLDGETRRAIDIAEGEEVDAGAFRALVKAAAARNGVPAKKAGPDAKAVGPIKARADENADVVLLSGGNPRIAKADGDAPVQAYIAALPGWKRDLGRRLDALIVRNVPDVRKAVKWNSPFYGVDGLGWFLSFHAFNLYIKVTFFRGASLQPIPPGGTERSKDARWIDVREGELLDEAQLANWLKQAAALPGWIP
ncbi:DUF1801 domain-containing protein [Paludisphaera mucosa]|uniref:DUF1801 domain-containing protein n=1 Tax=Paludisphaera mucosa TaxID=3030827 RepID=A0ABT6F9V7_9BACT|nr:DUF1801 domain-containing protein [Paludisphaera mucosa]MDG3004362.1 DUF1801 domain-containing protein [Paludisphaera mucosa]